MSASLFKDYPKAALGHEIKKLLQLSVPIFIGMLSTSVLSLTDSLMSGAIGTEDLAAISLGSVMFFPVALFCLWASVPLPPTFTAPGGSPKSMKPSLIPSIRPWPS